MKEYYLCSGDKYIGTFTMNGEERRVELYDNLNSLDIPYDFLNEYESGQRIFQTDSVNEWIVDRVIPSSRQNIDTILEDIGLSEYSEIGIFLHFNGKHVKDKFSIEEIQ